MPDPDQPVVDVPKDATCLGCGYRLWGLSEPRCPECGRVFSPGVETTYRRLSDPKRVSRWIQRGPGWVLGAGVILTTGLVLLASSFPYGHFGWGLLASLGIMVFGPLWVIRMLACLIWLRVNDQLRQNAQQYWKRWAIPIVIVLFGMIIWQLEATERVRFELARPGMSSLAAQVQQNQVPTGPVRIGGTLFQRVEPVGQAGTAFFMEGVGFFNTPGWVYLPDPADQAAVQADGYLGSYDVTPYRGDWYIVNSHPF